MVSVLLALSVCICWQAREYDCVNNERISTMLGKFMKCSSVGLCLKLTLLKLKLFSLSRDLVLGKVHPAVIWFYYKRKQEFPWKYLAVFGPVKLVALCSHHVTVRHFAESAITPNFRTVSSSVSLSKIIVKLAIFRFIYGIVYHSRQLSLLLFNCFIFTKFSDLL